MSKINIVPAGVAELADALDLGSSVFDVGVQVLSPAPNKTNPNQFCGTDFFILLLFKSLVFPLNKNL